MSSVSQIRIRARLAKPPEYVLVKFPRYEREFFLGYANFILGLILSREIREVLSNLVSAEGIRSDRSIDLRVMIFPARQLRRHPSRILYGSYSHSLAQISLYPLRISKDRIRREGRELFSSPLDELSVAQRKLIGEIATAAISTLIHEVLHVKFQQRSLARYVEEGMVQRLEKTYMRQWADKIDGVLRSQFSSLIDDVSAGKEP
jgi:NurA-like 5'-3' nuclease